MHGDVVTVQRLVHAPPEAIFAIVADPGRHRDIDGSGAIQGAKVDAPMRLALGSTFGMSMRVGIPYSMMSTVIEFEDNRRIAWQTRPPGPVGRIAAGRIWRSELEPVDRGSVVKESWDLSEDKQRWFLKLGPLPETTRKNMETTLACIEELAAAT